MEQTQVQPEPVKEKVGGVVHLPGRHEGVALCGVKLAGPGSPGKEKCVVCLDFTRRAWHVR
jgi:hypothetical protein